MTAATDPTRRFYGRWARLYDALAGAPGVDRLRATAADALDLDDGDTAVDLGCGTGANLPHLRERVGSDGRVVGVDLTPEMLGLARRRADRWPNVHVVRGDATRPPVARADGVLATFLVGLLDDPAAAVAEWCARCEGRVAMLDGASSRHPVGRLLNPAFGAFVAAGAPADSVAERVRMALSGAPRRRLDPKVRAARRALTGATIDCRHRTAALGFVHLSSGRAYP